MVGIALIAVAMTMQRGYYIEKFTDHQ